jgi:hypothetical protein
MSTAADDTDESQTRVFGAGSFPTIAASSGTAVMFRVPWFVIGLYFVAYAIGGMTIDAITGQVRSYWEPGLILYKRTVAD